MSLDVQQFTVDLSQLDQPKKPGISALMRIKNGAEFLRLSIESHLPYVDEIIACYNDCSDQTEAILQELQQEYPDKIRIFHYLPKVHPPLSEAHKNTPTESVHSLANYYNYTLAQARYSVATKLDDDHLAISPNLAKVVAKVRADLARGVRKIYTFSGINLIGKPDEPLHIYANTPFVGTGDHMFFPVCSAIYFQQNDKFEEFVFKKPRFEKEYQGILYFHLKHVKPGLGFHNLDSNTKQHINQDFLASLRMWSFTEFYQHVRAQELQKPAKRLEYMLRQLPGLSALVYLLTKRHPPLRLARLMQLQQDLACIDFQRDVEQVVRQFAAQPLLRHSSN